MKKTIFNIILLILFLIGLSRLIFRGSYIPMSGENQYTYSYIGQIRWIVNDWIDKPSLLFQSHKCIDCQYFGMYSRWVMIWLYAILIPGELLHINPFIWYVFVSFLVQYVALKYFLKSCFPRSQFSKLFISLLSIFFTTIPYRWIQLGDQWEYPFVYFMFFTIIGTYIRIIHGIKLSKRNVALTAIAALLIFNIGINHLPIFIYTIVALTIASFFVTKDKLLLINTLFAIYVPSMFFNSPMLISLVLSSDITQYSIFFSNNWPVLLSFGYLSSKHSLIFMAFSTVVGLSTLTISFLSLRKRELFHFILLIVFGFFLGLLGKDQIYQLIFDHIPLFHTLRSAYRFIIFEHIFLIILIGYLYIHVNKSRLRKVLNTLFLSAFILNFIFVSKSIKNFNFTKIPKAYADTYTTIAHNDYRYIYLPTQLRTGHSIPTDYTFGNTITGFYWWSKPFESWYPTRNTHHPTQHITNEELDKHIFSLYTINNQEELIKTLKDAGVKYIVLDKYYKWQTEVQEFNINAFFSKNEFELKNKFGLIEIYLVK